MSNIAEQHTVPQAATRRSRRFSNWLKASLLKRSS